MPVKLLTTLCHPKFGTTVAGTIIKTLPQDYVQSLLDSKQAVECDEKGKPLPPKPVIEGPQNAKLEGETASLEPAGGTPGRKAATK